MALTAGFRLRNKVGLHADNQLVAAYRRPGMIDAGMRGDGARGCGASQCCSPFMTESTAGTGKPGAKDPTIAEAGARQAAQRRRRWWARAALDISPLRESAAFRSLYLARTVSLLSVAILAVAVAWQVYGITDSSLHVAGVGVGLAAGSLIGSLWGGALADRTDRRRIIVLGRAAYVGVVAILWANSLRPQPGLA